MIRLALLAVAAAATLPITSSIAGAQTMTTADQLKHYNVTIRRFDPATAPASGQEFVLPVDSPDEEHAIASTLANAASWPGKVANGRPLPVAFMAVRVSPR